MSVLIYAESENGKFKKIALEVASYAKEIASQMGTTVAAVTFNTDDVSALGTYGVDKVLTVSDDKLSAFNAKLYASAIQQAAEKESASVIVLSSSANAKYPAPLLVVGTNGGYASNVVALPEGTEPFKVKRTAFTNKAFMISQIDAETKIIGLANNAFGLKENSASATVEPFRLPYPNPDLILYR